MPTARIYSHGFSDLSGRFKIVRRTYLTNNMATRRQALLLSSSNCHGFSLLEFAKKEMCDFLTKNNVSELLFVPYAQKDYDAYTSKMQDVIEPWGFTVTGLHSYPDVIGTVNSSKAIFVGGGNTFLLLKTLYEQDLVSLIKKKVDEGSLVYIGSSAGTNVATKSIHTTNDMPIIYPPSFEAIGIVPFNVNPHYIETEHETHKGETRDQRILEYLEMGHASPVLGLREGCILHVNGYQLTIKGIAGAVLFNVGDIRPRHYDVGSDMSFLCDQIKEVE
ncbi:probable alpha-aspartyl dipeptidase isoform X2 [Trichoplusia ni]|uniref:dipeptidase E n=1 Tax=Trichoplusia ni TaxID=7111 RepID=A0A7E5VF87_TRINI|nr:probable alpha-aspartyl dipeptidase isoform X2 [Trichoplusia ni]